MPALWVGLTYHADSRRAAWQWLRTYTIKEHRAALRDVPALGMETRLGGDSVRELGHELVRLADQGLTARVAEGLEDPRVLGYLDPIKALLESGRTFAEHSLERWEKDLSRNPAKYVGAFRVR